MVHPDVERAVRDRLGLDPGALGDAVLPRAVEHRMRALGAASESYAGMLGESTAELYALGAELVVPETWFFRGGRPLFDRLARVVAERAEMRRPVRILSVPCSTGEEPYSLVIALHEQLTPPADYQIDAVDLSTAHLERARAARFTSFAFREAGPDIRPAYFYPAGDRWDLRASISGAVRFRQGNVIETDFLREVSPFDIVICRNLFIYLMAEAKRKALANLQRLLAVDGLLCVTPAEADRLPPGEFTAEMPLGSGIYRRAAAPAKVLAPALAPSKKYSPRPAQAVPPRPAPVPLREVLKTTTEPDPLRRARSLADSGRMAEARVILDRLLGESLENADSHSLLGVIHQAEGRLAEAADSFRKALYLDPEHHEALEHMILICEERGDASQAAAMRRRLARVANEETP